MAKYIVQMRRGTATQWADSDIIPLAGEIVVEIDETNNLHKLKIGDGVHAYSELAYLQAGDEIVTQVLAEVKPRIVTVELTTNWTGTDGKYSQVVTLDGITEHSRLDLQPNADMLAEFKQLGLAFVTENNGGVITVYSVGDMPLKSYTMQATIVEAECTVENPIIGAPIGGSGSQVDWEQDDDKKADFIKNKPTLATVATSGSVYDLENAFGSGTITWDGNFTGKTSIDIMGNGELIAVKISDNVITKEDCINGINLESTYIGTREGEKETSFIDAETTQSSFRADGLAFLQPLLLFVPTDNYSLQVGTGHILDKGIYLAYIKYAEDSYMYCSRVTIPGYTGFDSNTFDPKLIPSIEKSMLAEDVQASLDKADTALQSFTETDPTVPAHVKSITTSDIANWNNKSDFSGDYNDLTNKPTLATIATTGNFNDLKDLPFSYSETGSDTLTWNGNSEGLISVYFGFNPLHYYKVKDNAVPVNSERSTVVYQGNDGSFETWDCENFTTEEYTAVVSNRDILLTLLVYSDTVFKGVPVTKGVYLPKYNEEYVRSVTIHGYTGFESNVLNRRSLPSYDEIPLDKKPFGEGDLVIIPEQDVDFLKRSEGIAAVLPCNLSLSAGDMLYVNFDGVTTSTYVADFDGDLYFGNLALAGLDNPDLENTGEEYVGLYSKNTTTLISHSDKGVGTYRIRISRDNIIKTLDRKYLPTIEKSMLASDVQESLDKADTALQSFTETDPTVPAWAKADTKPSYTADEVGAIPTHRGTGDTLTWNGDCEGKVSVNWTSSAIRVTKISDVIPTINDYDNGCIIRRYKCFNGKYDTQVLTAEDTMNSFNEDGAAEFSMGVYFIPSDNYSFSSSSLVFPERGVYFQYFSEDSGTPSFVCSLTIPGYDKFDSQTLNPGYLATIEAHQLSETIQTALDKADTALQPGANLAGLSEDENHRTVTDAEKTTWNEKLDKTGGTITGNLAITGDLTVNGTTISEDHETMVVEDNMVVLNSNKVDLQTAVSGIVMNKDGSSTYGAVYDPTDDTFKFGEGTLDANNEFAFKSGEGLPFAVREDSSKFTDGHLVEWDATGNKLVDSGKTLADVNTNTEYVLSSNLISDTTAWIRLHETTGDKKECGRVVVTGDGATVVTSEDNGTITISSTDTTRTAGATNTSDKLFLIGAPRQSYDPITFSHDTAFIGTDGCLYSDSKKVITDVDSALSDTSTNPVQNKTVKAALDGKVSADMGYVNKSLSWNASSYLQNVILLFPVPQSTTWCGHNFIDGRFFCWKTGGNVYDVVEVNANCVYGSLRYYLEQFGDHPTTELCVCKYNNVWYYALKCPYHANPYTNVTFVGRIASDLKPSDVSLPLGIPYFDENAQTALNSEVLNSITTTLTTTYVTSASTTSLYSKGGFTGNLNGHATSAANLTSPSVGGIKTDEYGNFKAKDTSAACWHVFSNDGTSRFSVYFDGTGAKVGSNEVIHSGNIGSQSVDYANSTGKLNGTASSDVTRHGDGVILTTNITNGTTGLFPASDNSNAILTVNRHGGHYDSQLGFSSDGNMYYRAFTYGTASNTTQGWHTMIHSGNISQYAPTISFSYGSGILTITTP